MLLIKFLIAKFRQSRRYMQQEVSLSKSIDYASEHTCSLDYPKHWISFYKISSIYANTNYIKNYLHYIHRRFDNLALTIVLYSIINIVLFISLIFLFN